MSANPAAEYLKAKIFTATPEQLQLMLFDGAVRYCEKARAALSKKNLEESFNSLDRAQKILLELNCCLKHDVAPDLCRNLAAIYTYCYRKLVEANIQHVVEPIDEVLELLRYQRETWVLLMQQLGKANATAAARKLDLPVPSARMEERISMSA